MHDVMVRFAAKMSDAFSRDCEIVGYTFLAYELKEVSKELNVLSD